MANHELNYKEIEKWLEAEVEVFRAEINALSEQLSARFNSLQAFRLERRVREEASAAADRAGDTVPPYL